MKSNSVYIGETTIRDSGANSERKFQNINVEMKGNLLPSSIVQTATTNLQIIPLGLFHFPL